MSDLNSFTTGPVSDPRARRSTNVADKIRAMIVSNELRPGDKLPTEDKLCKSFNVSRTTLREAVQTLRAVGLLEVTPGRGSFISVPRPEPLLKDLMLCSRMGAVSTRDARLLHAGILLDSARVACQAPADERRTLGILTVATGASAEENVRLDTHWQLRIMELAGNKLATTVVEALLCLLQNETQHRLRESDEIMRVMTNQIKVNQAIADGNQQAAYRLMASYLGVPLPIPAVNGNAMAA